MKPIKFAAAVFLWLFMTVTAFCQTDNTTDYVTYKRDGLTIISYSQKWGKDKLPAVYEELLNNFHGDEFKYLSKIILRPTSYNTVSGLYTNDITVTEKGLTFGKNCFIQVFNIDKYNTVKDFAHVLAHEYGHHFTLYNIAKSENAYYDKWENSAYVKVRSLKNYPVVYNQTEDFDYTWDILEIAANDYVQLLGSPNAKQSYKYKDAAQALESYSSSPDYIKSHFNAKPQSNNNIPLAADVPGLWEYFCRIAGKRPALSSAPAITKRPEITGIDSQNSFLNKKYTINFARATGNAPFEYTLVMYPVDFPFLSRAIKTVTESDRLTATIGTVVDYDDEGNIFGIFDYFTDKYIFVIYAKDSKGYYYSSQPYVYDFGQDSFDIYFWLNGDNELSYTNSI